MRYEFAMILLILRPILSELNTSCHDTTCFRVILCLIIDLLARGICQLTIFYGHSSNLRFIYAFTFRKQNEILLTIGQKVHNLFTKLTVEFSIKMTDNNDAFKMTDKFIFMNDHEKHCYEHGFWDKINIVFESPNFKYEKYTRNIDSLSHVCSGRLIWTNLHVSNSDQCVIDLPILVKFIWFYFEIVRWTWIIV